MFMEMLKRPWEVKRDITSDTWLVEVNYHNMADAFLVKVYKNTAGSTQCKIMFYMKCFTQCNIFQFTGC